MLSIPASRPLDPSAWEIIRAVTGAAGDRGVGYMIIGAMARDIVMQHVYDIPSGRRTRDVDFAVAVDSWDSFETLKQALVALGDFSIDNAAIHRLYYRQTELGRGYPLDLIPFGAIETAGHQLAWPPDMKVLMSVAGYAEAQQAALLVTLGGGLTARVVSIPALAFLKLFAWNDRANEMAGDAQDLYFLMKHYHDAGNRDRLYESELALLGACGYDLGLAGAMLLGADVRRILPQTGIDQLLGILQEQQKLDHLEAQMARDSGGDAAALIDKFLAGLRGNA